MSPATEVFVSHVAADAEVAGRLADALDAAGLSAWGGRAGDGDPDVALDGCTVFVLLASPDALGSARMTDEVVRAHENGTAFVPVLAGISPLELSTRQPAWRTAIGSATAIDVPPEGVDAITPRVLAGVRALTAPAPRRPPEGRSARAGLVGGIAVVVLALAAALVWWLVGRGGGDDPSDRAGPDATGSPSPVADSLTTPLTTVVGDLVIMQTALTTEFCAVGDDCVRTTGTDRLVVLTLRDPTWRKLDFTAEFADQMGDSYVQSGDLKAPYALAWQDVVSGIWGVAYKSVP
jgi:hypothetical protein